MCNIVKATGLNLPRCLGLFPPAVPCSFLFFFFHKQEQILTTAPHTAAKNNLHFTWNLFLSPVSPRVRRPVVCREVSGMDEDCGWWWWWWEGGGGRHVNVFAGRPLIFLPGAQRGSEDPALVSGSALLSHSAPPEAEADCPAPR